LYGAPGGKVDYVIREREKYNRAKGERVGAGEKKIATKR
jgi:hypothetical protein